MAVDSVGVSPRTLGLAICRRLAELLDGQIELQGEHGRGSVFSMTLILPISGVPGELVEGAHPEVTQREVKPLIVGDSAEPLVLAVDDNPINRNLLARHIRLLGLRAETAENGQAALSMWREGRFALVNGFALSIDDYGTGSSNIQQLTRIAFSELKIDQSFVKDFADSKALRIVVESSIDMARKLLVRSVAEGVETQKDWDGLKRVGCDTVQGYFVARPMDEAAFRKFVVDFVPL